MLKECVEYLVSTDEKKAANDLLEAFYRTANNLAQLNDIASIANKVKHHPLVVTIAQKMLKFPLEPVDQYSVKSNLANALVDVNYPDKALEIIEELEKIIENDRDIQLKKSYANFLMGRLDTAEQIIKEQLESPYLSDKHRLESNFNLATYELYDGEFKKGMKRFFKYGRLLDTWSKLSLPYPQWRGEDPNGYTLILVGEGGIGDNLVNVRFMNHLKERGANPVWVTDRPDLIDLFEANGYKTASHYSKVLGPKLHWCYSMELPSLLDLDTDQLWKGPYLKPSKEAIDNLAPIKKDKLNIGFRWHGSPYYEQNDHRTIELKRVLSVARTVIDKDTFVAHSLQRDEGLDTAELHYLNVVDHESDMNTFDNTMALISQLDLVITSCTSVAHAALSQNIPTIVFVPLSSYYVWCQHSNQSPWYGNHYVLKQTEPREWERQYAELQYVLKGWLETGKLHN